MLIPKTKEDKEYDNYQKLKEDEKFNHLEDHVTDLVITSQLQSRANRDEMSLLGTIEASNYNI